MKHSIDSKPVVVEVLGGVVTEVHGAPYELIDWDNAKAGATIDLSDAARDLLSPELLEEIDVHNDAIRKYGDDAPGGEA